MTIKEKVYKLVARIPKGKVLTYGQVAKKLKLKTPRIVGKYLHENENPRKVPCYRVVFADGSLSKSYVFGGIKKQKEKLKKEGIKFVNDRVNIKEYGSDN